MVKYHEDLIQGTEEWLRARLGLLTASETKKIITPTLKIAKNQDSRSHVYDIAAQRVTKRLPDNFQSWDMERGNIEEAYAKDYYSATWEQVKDCGFVTNDEWGFTLGYSPDGLVGDDGLIEVKSRASKHQMKTIIEGDVPQEYMLQIQTGLLITGREWCDFLSYSNGMPMMRVTVLPDKEIHEAIIEAATGFEGAVKRCVDVYNAATNNENQFIPTEYREYSDFGITSSN